MPEWEFLPVKLVVVYQCSFEMMEVLALRVQQEDLANLFAVVVTVGWQLLAGVTLLLALVFALLVVLIAVVAEMMEAGHLHTLTLMQLLM